MNRLFLFISVTLLFGCQMPAPVKDHDKKQISYAVSLPPGNADWQELQGLIDAAKGHSEGVVTVKRNYTIDRPLIVSNWDGTKYNQVSLTIQGFATMWDRGQRSVIKATFKDAPIISVQCGKGVILRGLNIQATAQGRDSRYSPQAAICIDPFSGLLPADSGYPSLREWYRGPQTRSGSTGIRIEDCSFNNVVCGFISSPNGYTQNAEIITLQNIRLQAVKYGIVGCQAQEKENRVINLGAWGPTNCVFVFTRYGAGQPGNWFVDGVNIAGSVDSIIHRASAGWGQMTMTHVFAEQIKTIGYWYAGSGDVFSESLINMKFPKETGYYPDNTLYGSQITLQNMNIRYYGDTKIPVLLRGSNVQGGAYYLPPITNVYGWDSAGQKGFRIVQPFGYSNDTVIGNKVAVKLRYPTNAMPGVGSHIIFMQAANWQYEGQGQIDRISNDTAFLRYVSPGIKKLTNIRVGVYVKI